MMSPSPVAPGGGFFFAQTQLTTRERELIGDQGEKAVDKAVQEARRVGEKAQAKKDELVERADARMSPEREPAE